MTVITDYGQSQDEQALTGRGRMTVQVVFLSENSHFKTPALEASFAVTVGVWKSGISFIIQLRTRSIEFPACFCSVETKMSNDIQHKCKIKCCK